MGKQLIEKSTLFRSIVKQCDEVLHSLANGPSWSAMEELCQPKETSRIYESALSQPLCTVLQIGLVELWRSWGLRPVAVVGHSSGEIVAAYCAGNLTLKDCVSIAFYRGLYLGSGSGTVAAKAAKTKGSMCAVGLGEKDAKELLKEFSGRLALAAVNSPSSCTLSGDEDAVLEVVDACKKKGIISRQLKVDMAYHSHHMLPLATKYEAAMVEAGVKPISVQNTVDQTCQMFTSVRGRQIGAIDCGPSYWTKNMVSTVSFAAAVTEMIRHCQVDAIVELGPHPALKGPVEDTLASLGINGLPYFSSCSRGKPDFVAMLETVGSMVPAGLKLRLEHINAVEVIDGANISHRTGKVLTDLPNYPWDHSTSFWGETRSSRNYRHREQPRHELLGARNPSDNPLSMSWRNLISLRETPWLADWKVCLGFCPSTSLALTMSL